MGLLLDGVRDARKRGLRFSVLVGLGLLVIDSGAATDANPAEPAFVERAASLGLDFNYFNGAVGELFFAEMMGGGAALFDYDRDGDLDAYLVQGDFLLTDGTETIFAPPSATPSDRLFRNDLQAGENGGRARFVDVTSAAGVPAGGYGMGVASGDHDNDGWPDLYVTQLGPNRLLRNRGDGSFEEVTAGLEVPDWSVAAVFFDYDLDGWLDLYVGNYTDYRLATDRPCYLDSGLRDYCGPLAYEWVGDRLFHNRGDGTFEDVTKRAGLGGAAGAALGAVSADFNGDGWPDLYVANDQAANYMWINQSGEGFVDEAILSGTAVNFDGAPEASMGVVVGDLNGDGLDDLFMAHLARETNTLYLNQGEGFFSEATADSGMGPASWLSTGFGVGMLDFDQDGDLDLLVANGAVKRLEDLAREGDPVALAQPDQLFENLGGGRFAEVTAARSGLGGNRAVGRGVAVGDVDNDGDTDALVVNNPGPARLLENDSSGAAWLGVRIAGANGSDRLGSRLRFQRADGGVASREVRTEGSYASSHDPRVVMALGKNGAGAELRSLNVQRPAGGRLRLVDPPTGVYLNFAASQAGRATR